MEIEKETLMPTVITMETRTEILKLRVREMEKPKRTGKVKVTDFYWVTRLEI
jgi:hypothetical protein